jgi:heat shock protein HslJ
VFGNHKAAALVTSVLLAVTLSATLAGCVGGSGSPTPRTTLVHPGSLVGTWALEDRFDSPEQPFISFVQDSTWSASDGCNRVQGRWTITRNGSLTTTSGPQTRMSCEGAQLPLAVEHASRVEIRGKKLVIHSTSDSTETTLKRTTDRTIGPQGRPVGYWTESRTPTSPFLSIQADETYSGNDGCNSFTGTWLSGSSDSIAFTPGVTTLMACEGVDQWLNQLARGSVRAGVMTIQSENGTVIGQLSGM